LHLGRGCDWVGGWGLATGLDCDFKMRRVSRSYPDEGRGESLGLDLDRAVRKERKDKNQAFLGLVDRSDPIPSITTVDGAAAHMNSCGTPLINASDLYDCVAAALALTDGNPSCVSKPGCVRVMIHRSIQPSVSPRSRLKKTLKVLCQNRSNACNNNKSGSDLGVRMSVCPKLVVLRSGQRRD
jgi:hypothetical protein